MGEAEGPEWKKRKEIEINFKIAAETWIKQTYVDNETNGRWWLRDRVRRMNEVHCAVLICLSITLLFLLNTVYHCGNCHLDVSMWGRWEVKMCYSRQEAEIVGPPPPNRDQNNGTSVLNNWPQRTEYFCSSATLSSACAEIIQPRGSDEGWKFFFFPP